MIQFDWVLKISALNLFHRRNEEKNHTETFTLCLRLFYHICYILKNQKQFGSMRETKSINPICLFGFLLYLVCLNSGRKFVFILSFTSLNNYCRLPFRSGGLWGRLLIAKLSKSLMLGPSNFSATDCVVVVVKFRFIDRCCRRLCWWSGDTFAADLRATANANRLSFVSFWWAVLCDAVKFCNNWVVLSLL